MSEINKIYRPLYSSSKRYFFLTGGRASLKSSTVHDFIARLTYESGHGVLFTRYTMTSAEKSIIPEFKLTLERLGIENDFHVTKNVVTNTRTGSFIYFSGIKTSSGDQTGNLKSISGITTWVIEEGEDFHDEKTFDTIDDSIRTNTRQNRIIWIQNPSTKEHFIYKRWILPNNKKVMIEGYNVTVSNLPQVEHIHSTYHIGVRFLSQQWIEKANSYRVQADSMENKYKSWYYTNYIGGWLEKSEGVVFEKWSEGIFPALPFCFGQDYGFHPDPLGLIKVAVDNKEMKIYLEEMLYELRLSNDQIVNRYEGKGIRKTDLIVTDTNEPRTTQYLQEKGYNIIGAVKREIVEDIREIQKYELVVCGDSPNLKMELNHYIWNDKKASIPIDAYNHCFIGSTLIETIFGDKPIVDVIQGDIVRTSTGFQKVIKKWNNRKKQINNYSIQLDTHSLNLSCTEDHLIRTEKGWTKISKLESGMTIFLSRSSTEKPTGSTPKKGTFQEALKGCTYLCGNTITAKFQRAFMSIIRTKTLGIITLKILNALNQINTYQSMGKGGMPIIPSGLKRFRKRVESVLRNGMLVMREDYSIRNKQLNPVLVNGNSTQSHAYNAQPYSNQKPIIQNFVRTNANQPTGEKTDLMTSQENVNVVAQTIKSISILNKSYVVESVYDLMVENDHEYFANGVLVHNCIDPMRYAYRKLTTPYPKQTFASYQKRG